MKDYRVLFGWAAVVFALAFLLRTFQPAYAVNGPNINFGSNPIFSAFSNNCSSDEVVATVPNDSVLIITDVVSAHFGDDTITLKISSGDILAMFHQEHYMTDTYHSSHRGKTYNINGNTNKISSGIVVPSGEQLVIACTENKVMVSGYFAHQ